MLFLSCIFQSFAKLLSFGSFREPNLPGQCLKTFAIVLHVFVELQEDEETSGVVIPPPPVVVQGRPEEIGAGATPGGTGSGKMSSGKIDTAACGRLPTLVIKQESAH